MRIAPATRADLGPWSEMRYALWTWDTPEDHAEQAEEIYLSGHPDRAAFLAFDEAGQAIRFAEACLRRDYVEGCETSPVVFLEGVFVKTGARLGGVARALADAVADWGRTQGCTEYASNTLLDHGDSLRFHAAIGFEETERVVYFRRDL